MTTTTSDPGELTQDINVLPLIDVLLVLIIIFMVLLRGLIFIPAEIPPPASSAPPGRGAPQIVLELRADGSYAINRQPIPAGQLDTQLHAIYDARRVKLLFIKAAEELPYQAVITTMDLARGAGVQVLAWVPRTGTESEGESKPH
jgi:biopolymer transport protein ExbD